MKKTILKIICLITICINSLCATEDKDDSKTPLNPSVTDCQPGNDMKCETKEYDQLLPNEVLSLIFPYLHDETLINIYTVSHQFEEVVDFVWMNKVLKTSNNKYLIHLSYFYEAYDIRYQETNGLSDVMLRNCFITDYRLGKLLASDYFGKLKIEKLDLQGNYISKNLYFSDFTYLKELNLSHNKINDTNALSLKLHEKLEKLILTNNPLNFKKIQELRTVLKAHVIFSEETIPCRSSSNNWMAIEAYVGYGSTTGKYGW